MRKIGLLAFAMLVIALSLPAVHYLYTSGGVVLQALKGIPAELASTQFSIDLLFQDWVIYSVVVFTTILVAAALGLIGSLKERRIYLFWAGLLCLASSAIYYYGARIKFVWRGEQTGVPVDYYLAAAGGLLLLDLVILGRKTPSLTRIPAVGRRHEKFRVRSDREGYYERSDVSKLLGDDLARSLAEAGVIVSHPEQSGKVKVMPAPSSYHKALVTQFLSNPVNWNDRRARWVNYDIFIVFLKSFGVTNPEALAQTLEQEGALEFDAARASLRLKALL